MPKVLFLHHGDDKIRGSEVYLIEQLKRIEPNIHPLVLCNQPAFASALHAASGTTARHFDFPQVMIDPPTYRLQVPGLMMAAYKLYSIMSREGVDLVYSNNGRPMQAAYIAARCLNLPIVVHVHCPYARRYTQLYRLHRADCTIFVSHTVTARMTAQASFKRYETVHCGIDTDSFAPVPRDEQRRAALGIAPNDIVIGQVGSVIPRKGFDILLRAFAAVHAAHANTKLLFVGSGSHDRELGTLAQSLGVSDDVITAGEADSKSFFQHVIDINVLASREEGLGLVLAEAGACGLPNVAAETDGIPEVVQDQYSGLLFPRGDHDALADRLNLLITRPDLRHAFGQHGRRIATEKFSVQKQSTLVNTVIRKAIAGAAESRRAS